MEKEFETFFSVTVMYLSIYLSRSIYIFTKSHKYFRLSVPMEKNLRLCVLLKENLVVIYIIKSCIKLNLREFCSCLSIFWPFSKKKYPSGLFTQLINNSKDGYFVVSVYLLLYPCLFIRNFYFCVCFFWPALPLHMEQGDKIRWQKSRKMEREKNKTKNEKLQHAISSSPLFSF